MILAPTRELATQIDATLAPLAAALGLRTLTVFGGVSANRQTSGLRGGVDIVVACPGRLADHLQSGHVRLDAIEITVLDEADHMADLGFLPVVRRLMDQTPKAGQRMLFSATLDGDVNVLVKRFLSNPVTHSVDSSLSPVSAMAHHVLHIQSDDRLAVLTDLTSAPGRTLVFTRTKRGAKMLTRRLVTAGVPAVELHGNLAQNARNRNLEAFSTGAVQTLVATDIAARGIHVDDIGLVVHFDPPTEHKAYLHRSGRTARAGNAGTVITLMSDDQVRDVRDLTRKAGIQPTTTRLRPGHELLAELAPGERSFVKPPVGALAAERDGAPGRGGGGGGGGGVAVATARVVVAMARAADPVRAAAEQPAIALEARPVPTARVALRAPAVPVEAGAARAAPRVPVGHRVVRPRRALPPSPPAVASEADAAVADSVLPRADRSLTRPVGRPGGGALAVAAAAGGEVTQPAERAAERHRSFGPPGPSTPSDPANQDRAEVGDSLALLGFQVQQDFLQHGRTSSPSLPRQDAAGPGQPDGARSGVGSVASIGVPERDQPVDEPHRAAVGEPDDPAQHEDRARRREVEHRHHRRRGRQIQPGGFGHGLP